MYVEAAGQGWAIEKLDGRVVLVQRIAVSATPTMIVRTWIAPGLRDYIDEAGKAFPVQESRDGSLSISGNVYRPIPLERPKGEPLSQVEEPIKAPRGKWRWDGYGRWQNTAKR